jgi:hypothetical protein
MMIDLRRGLVASIALAVALATTLEAQQKSADFHWSGAVAPGRTLRIMNVNGSIRATGASGNDVVVSAVRKSKKSDPATVEIRVDQDADGTTICAVWPSQGGSGCGGTSHNHSHNNDNNDVSVDFTVEVPAGVLFNGETVNGSVAATGLTANAEVSTVNGDASLSTKGTGSAETVNGNVSITMGSSAWTGELEAKTINGSVTVEMPKPTNLEVVANTQNGSITSDFPLMIQGKMSPRSIRGTIGNGGPKLDLSTVNGEIRLKQVS